MLWAACTWELVQMLCGAGLCSGEAGEGCVRNWSAILIDAGLRGVNATQIAHEQRCSVQNVVRRARAYGVLLANSDMQHDRNSSKAIETRETKRRELWARRLAELPPGLTLNELCCRFRCSYTAAKTRAEAHGYKFAPSQGRCRPGPRA